MSIWARLRIDLSVSSFARRPDGSSILPEQPYLDQAAQDPRFQTELLAEVLANFLCDHKPVKVNDIPGWNRARGLLHIIRRYGDPIYYDLLLQWIEKNQSTILGHNRSGILVRMALEILYRWQVQNPEQVAHWKEILFTDVFKVWFTHEQSAAGQYVELRNIPVPREWKRIALRAWAISEPEYLGRHLCLWPTWTQDLVFDATLLRQLWDTDKGHQAMVEAIYHGRYGPFRDPADDAHRALLGVLAPQEKEALAQELRHLHDLADPFRHPTTRPPKAAS